SGVITMNQPHLIVVGTKPIVVISADAQSLAQGARALLTASNPVSAYQSHLNAIAAYVDRVGEVEAETQLFAAYDAVFDPISDSAALRALDDALANHVFYGPGVSGTPSAQFERTYYLYVNGINTPFAAVPITRGIITNLISSVSVLHNGGDSVGYFYNR